MDRTRASSLESRKNFCDKYDSLSSISQSKFCRRNRLHSMVGNSRDCSDESAPLDYYYNRDCKRPSVANNELKSQFDILQCTVNRMLNGGAFDDMSSTTPSANLSEALKHEYRQMMSALKELESILGCQRKTSDIHSFSTATCTNDVEIHQLQREIYFRDSLIKCLSDRLKVLCKANDKLIIDYENQENILSEELICLKRQLEKAKDALRSLSMLKSHSNVSVIQDLENEAYYLRESLRTKEKMISDLKHRFDKMSRENADLKCELENKGTVNSRYATNQLDRELSYSHHFNEQMQIEIESLKSQLECKNQLVNELERKLDMTVVGLSDTMIVNKLKEELLLANEENEMTKEAILEQSDMLEDFKNQIKVLSENNLFKDETISELRCCLRKLNDCPSGSIPIRDVTPRKSTDDRGSQSLEIKVNDVNSLLNSIKRYINQNQPDLLQYLDNQLSPYNTLEKFIIDIIGIKNKVSSNHEDVELFKEHLTNEINLKNIIIKFLVNNLTGDIESLLKFQSQMNTILAIDMDSGFKNDLKNYLHQCFLLDDNLRLVIEYLVKQLNGITLKNKALSSENISLVEKMAIYVPNTLRDKQSVDTNSRLTTVTTNTPESIQNSPTNDQLKKINLLEEELKILNGVYQKDKQRYNSEIEAKNQKLSELQKIIDEKSKIDAEFKKLSSDYKDILNKSKECLFENDKLKGEIEVLSMKNKQIDRNLNLKHSELENMEVAMRRVSDQFVSLSTTQEHVKKSIEAMKDAEIERLNKEIEDLKLLKKNSDELRLFNNEQMQKIASLTKDIDGLETQNTDLKKMISNLQKELDKVNLEKKNLLDSITQIKAEKNKEINELKASLEPKNTLQLKSIQTDPNIELTETIERLKRENDQLSKQLKHEELQSGQLRTSINTLKIEQKTMEIRHNSINSDKGSLEIQIKQLKEKINEMNRNCEENHVNKSIIKSQNEQSELYKQKVVDLEGILACLTDELNEKVQLVEDLRKVVKSDEACTKPCLEAPIHSIDTMDVNKQIILQKDSEIAFLKSKLEVTEELSRSRHSTNDRLSVITPELQNLRATVNDLERRISHLNQQLTDRSENIAQLQKLLKEKDEMIENYSKVIKTKDDSVGEMEKMIHKMSLENTNIKDELTGKLEDESQIKLLESSVKNLTAEIIKLRTENDKCRSELNKLNLEKLNKLDNLAPQNMKTSSSDPNSKRLFSHSSQQPSTLPDSSVQQINNEIQKLYIDFEGKSNEIKEYSLKEIKNRDNKIDEINLELKLKSDQFTTLMVENRRLLDKLEDESQRSSKYEQNLVLKEQLLDKLMKEKEKIRATFITELRNKNEELNEKSKTVYFLNAELHRLASEVEILHSELQVVKVSDKYQAQSKQVIEITEANLEKLKSENNSLKLCINLKMDEIEAMKNELTIKQIHNNKLQDEVEFYATKSNEIESNLNVMKMDTIKTESMMQKTIDSLSKQLKDVEDSSRNLNRTKSELEAALRDLEKENLSLKMVNEMFQKEKANYTSEIHELRNKLSILNDSLSESKNQIVRKSLKSENDQQELKRLSDVVFSNEKSILNQSKTLNQALQQIDELTEENTRYKLELEKMSNKFYEIEEEYRILSGKFSKCNEDLKTKESEMIKYKEIENHLNNGLQQKHSDCEQLKKDYDELLKQYEDLENQERKALRSLDEKHSQCSYIQENLEHVRQQLYMTEDNFKTCNSQWLEKYGILKSNYERMEYDYIQIQNQLDTINEDRGVLETTINSLNCKINNLTDNYRQLNEDNAHLRRESCFKSTELDRLCCEKNSLQNCNMELTSQIESMSGELLGAHTEICELTVQLRECESQIKEISCRNIPSIRHYGSHPVLNQADSCHSNNINFELKDYCDLKTRYSSLCGQIDNLTCQMKKKDKRVLDLQKELDTLTRKLSNCEQVQCDYQELDFKYQQLKDDFNNLSQYYQNVNFSHNSRNPLLQNNDVSVIQVCTDELQETINCLNQEINHLKLSLQNQQHDYQICCGKIMQLEEQIQLDNLELEKWNQAFCSSENNYEDLKVKFDKLNYAYDEAIRQLDQVTDCKQQIIDKSNRILEITNINENIEQQILKAHQQISSQNQIIEDYKMKMRDLEMLYEQELERCRHETMFMKSNDKINVQSEMNDKISCLKEKNRSLECELMEIQNQYHIQFSNFNQLRKEQERQLQQTEELRQEYDDQCANIDKLAGQLFDKNELIEHLTAENHQLSSEIDCQKQKVQLLTEQLECVNQCLIDKSNELIMTQTNLEVAEENGMLKDRETIDLSNHVEYLSEQIERRNNELDDFQKELSMCYDTINESKRHETELCGELDTLQRVVSEKDQCIFNKNEMLSQYSKELEMNYDIIKNMQSDSISKQGISIQEYCSLKVMNDKLTEEIGSLRSKLSFSTKATETQTQKESKLLDLDCIRFMSPSPISDIQGYNDPDQWLNKEREKSPVSEVTYSSSKSVAWKSTHTDHQDALGSGVLELQKAIDEYNTLVTNIEIADGISNPSLENQSIKRLTTASRDIQGSSSKDISNIDQKIDIDFQNADEVDVIVVDVDAMGKSSKFLNQSDQQIANEEDLQQLSLADDVTYLKQPDFKDIISLLKNSDIKIDYEGNEPFESYFQRMLLKYNDLEQFYLASMKINLDNQQDPNNFKTIEMFSELYEKSQQKLIQHCQLLKASMAYNTLEVNDSIQPTNDQKLNSEDILDLINLVSTQQLQLSALNVVHKKLQQATPLDTEKPQNISSKYFTQEYKGIWSSKEVCGPNILSSPIKAQQKSIQNQLTPIPKNKANSSIIASEKVPYESIKLLSSSRASHSKTSVKNEEFKPRTSSIHNSEMKLESLKTKPSLKTAESITRSVEKDTKVMSLLKSSSKSPPSLIKNDTKSINFGKTTDLSLETESVRNQVPTEKETRISSSVVQSFESSRSTGPKFQQQFQQGVSMSESKTQSIKNLDDSVGFASISQFEKEMHQLNNIDFDNFDNSINIKDRARIYAAEIDYLNEKNLFHTYAINTLSNPSRYPRNSNFINQINASLTSKAEFINRLQSEFKFDPHLSKKEKELINKVLDSKNDFTYKKLFESWVNEAKPVEAPTALMNKINELTKKLELCQSELNSTDIPKNEKIIESLVADKRNLSTQLEECTKNLEKLTEDYIQLKTNDQEMIIDKLYRENENLKEMLKGSPDKMQTMTQQSPIDKMKQSKIPLLRGSSIEGAPATAQTDRKSLKWEDVNRRALADMTNISKNIAHVTDSLVPFKNTNGNTTELVKSSSDIKLAAGKMIQAIDDVNHHSEYLGKDSKHFDDKSLLQSAGKLVSPEEVKSAISKETSIENLKAFANLLAEDNFDLAAEIEKLLGTIEELRRQLKENCEILSETVDMLQNSENFVNQLEKKLNIETKKTQVITTRIDKLNELNGKVILELERMLKQPSTVMGGDMTSQERYDYLFVCLKKIEAENLNLQTQKEKLEFQIPQ